MRNTESQTDGDGPGICDNDQILEEHLRFQLNNGLLDVVRGLGRAAVRRGPGGLRRCCCRRHPRFQVKLILDLCVVSAALGLWPLRALTRRRRRRGCRGSRFEVQRRVLLRWLRRCSCGLPRGRLDARLPVKARRTERRRGRALGGQGQLRAGASHGALVAVAEPLRHAGGVEQVPARQQYDHIIFLVLAQADAADVFLTPLLGARFQRREGSGPKLGRGDEVLDEAVPAAPGEVAAVDRGQRVPCGEPSRHCVPLREHLEQRADREHQGEHGDCADAELDVFLGSLDLLHHPTHHAPVPQQRPDERAAQHHREENEQQRQAHAV
mmetsp:Transcript_69333/g.225049  ORF Transcript_69333/g.225049 Transcript_69333/m.225049 type:complete len:325 (-) Transcript_69333:245-1219(-)